MNTSVINDKYVATGESTEEKQLTNLTSRFRKETDHKIRGAIVSIAWLENARRIHATTQQHHAH